MQPFIYCLSQLGHGGATTLRRYAGEREFMVEEAVALTGDILRSYMDPADT